jgi:trk system potassium uptake protein TrkH
MSRETRGFPADFCPLFLSRAGGDFAIVRTVKKENPGKKKHRKAAAGIRSGAGSAVAIPVVTPDDETSLPPLAAPPEWLGPGLLIPLYTLVIVIGYLLLARGFCTIPGNPLKIEQSLFTSINAATLTGFQQARSPHELLPRGQWLLLGLILTGIQFSFLAGGLAVVRIVRMRFTDYQVLIWSVALTAAVALVGWGAFHGQDRTNFDSLFLAVSAFGNCGLSTGPLPGPADVRSHLVLVPLMVLGGIGLPVLMEIGDLIVYRRRLSSYSRLVIRWTAGAYIATFLLLLPLRWCGTGPVSWLEAVAGSSIEAINARSGGFMVDSVGELPQVLTAAMMLVMIVGATPAGTGGGMKLTAVATLVRGARDAAAGRVVRRIAIVAGVWAMVYLAIIAAFTGALLISESDGKLESMLFLAVSAVGNVGLSHSLVQVSAPGLYILSAAMILGRIMPVLVLWYTVDKVPEAGIAVA